MAGSEKRLVVAVVGDAVPALGGADYRAAGLDDLGGGGEALHSLVEVEVQGIAAVGSDYHVKGLGGVGRMATLRAKAQAEACSAKSSPAWTLVMRCASSTVTSMLKVTPVSRAMRRMASWTGFPAVTAHVALGWPMRGAEWSFMMVSTPARPGADHLGAAAEPGEEVGLDEAEGYADVGLQPNVG